MMIRSAALVAAMSLVLGGTAWAEAPAPVRHLVYNFTYTNTQTVSQHESGISSSDQASPLSASGMAGGSGGLTGAAPASGVSESKNAVGDRGTITVDVVRVEQDTGLVVTVSEQAHDSRSTQPATCVVYGSTNVICDSSKQVNTEELALLRLLGSNFVDPAQIDAKNHWRVDQSGPVTSDVADFSIGKNDSGVMQITSLRVLKASGAQGFTSTTDGTITYDYARLIPTAIVEDETLRKSGGMGGYTTVRTQTTLALATDSAASKP